MRASILGIGSAVVLAFTIQARADDIDWTKVDAALGKTASVQGDIHRYGIPAATFR